MKKLLMIVTFGVMAFACGDRNRSAERDMDRDDNTDIVSPDVEDDTLNDDRTRTDTTYNQSPSGRDTAR